MYYDFYSKHVPRDADFFVCCLNTHLLPRNKFDALLMKKFVTKNPDVNVQEQVENCLKGKRSGMVSQLVNRDYDNCDVLFIIEPVPLILSTPAPEENCQTIHRLYKFILEKAKSIGCRHICIPLFGVREGLDVPTAFSIFVEHMETFRKLQKGPTKLERIYAVVDQKKASKQLKRVINRTRNNLEAMRKVIRIFGAMTEPLYGNIEGRNYEKMERIDGERILTADVEDLETQMENLKDNLIDSLIFEN